MSSSWKRSWLSSWLNSWGKTDQGRSGWFRLWLADLQKKANDERDKEVQPTATQKAGEEAQGIKSVPAVIKRAKPEKERKTRKSKVESPNLSSGVTLEIPAYQAPVLDQPLPDFSLSVYQRLRDSANQEQFKQHKRRREEDALILLLAA